MDAGIKKYKAMANRKQVEDMAEELHAMIGGSQDFKTARLWRKGDAMATDDNRRRAPRGGAEAAEHDA